ncbi:YqeB family protein [Paenibacillus chitinolyticus]|uniref:YqeB family protein n=1 Tax=Paenibacillus chitinolyticus TaxID=79263 RepID=UPI003D03A782
MTSFHTQPQQVTVGLDNASRIILLAGPVLLGGVLGYFIPSLARLALKLPWIPYQGPIEAITSFHGPWVSLVTALLGAAAGLWFTGEAFKEIVFVTLSEQEIQLKKNGRVQTIPKESVRLVFMDGKQMVILGEGGRELARETYEAPAESLPAALQPFGYTWSGEGDPYKERYARWVPDMPGVSPPVNALLKAREQALQKKEKEEAAELRREIAKLGVVVRDEGTRQYWRGTDEGRG